MKKNGKRSTKKIKDLLKKCYDKELFRSSCIKIKDDEELKYLLESFLILIDKNKEINANEIWRLTKNKEITIQFMEACL